MRFRTSAPALAAAVLLLAASGFAFDDTRTMTLPSEGIRALEIECGAGFLKVRGEEGLSSIEVRADIVISDVDARDKEEFIKDHLDLRLERRGDRAILVSKIGSRHGFRFLIGEDERIDLTVRVPKTLALSVDDGSGGIEIADVGGDTVIDDGSGSIRVERLGGNLRIDDGSGGIEVFGVRGDVEIDDGSGEMEIRDIGGSVTVDDGSGSIDIDGVRKDVDLKRVGSGGVRVVNVSGRVTGLPRHHDD